MTSVFVKQEDQFKLAFKKTWTFFLVKIYRSKIYFVKNCKGNTIVSVYI